MEHQEDGDKDDKRDWTRRNNTKRLTRTKMILSDTIRKVIPMHDAVHPLSRGAMHPKNAVAKKERIGSLEQPLHQNVSYSVETEGVVTQKNPSPGLYAPTDGLLWQRGRYPA